MSCSSASSWSWTALVPFERVVTGLRRAADPSERAEPDRGCRERDLGAEQALAHYDRLLLRAARMLEVRVPEEAVRLTWEQRDALVEALAARGLHDVRWRW